MGDDFSNGTIETLENKLSFVLPLTLSEAPNTAEKYSWRSSPDDGAIARTRLLLESFTRHFQMTDLEIFLIICPTTELDLASELVRSVTRDLRFQVVAEVDPRLAISNILDPRYLKSPVPGWYIQQIIKLAASAAITTSHYVTVDSDIFFRRPVNVQDVIRNYTSLVNTETCDYYALLYTEDFARLEAYRKRKRYASSAALLGYQRPAPLACLYYGETPVILHTQSVRNLRSFLESRFDRPWHEALASERGWSEYSLYFQFLEMTDSLRTYHIPAGPNTILDLERSVWQESRYYQHLRNYDEQHFANGDNSQGGFAVAVQSWLPIRSWLPSCFEGLDEFYTSLCRWNSRSSPISRGE